MPVYGDLGTMPLADVLQWIGVAQKTGVLEVERGGAKRRIEFNKGFVGACHAAEPSSQLGQLLVARRLVSDEQLRQALEQQAVGGKRLGFILVEQGALTEQDVRRMITAHVEQAVQCLFEWDGAVFRFHEGASFDPMRVEVSLSIHDILLKTLQYQDELKQIRGTFPSSGIVLCRSDAPVPEELSESEMSRKIFESVDGRRTIGEVVIEAQASEILVLKFLHRLVSMGLVQVGETRDVPNGTGTLLDPLPPVVDPAGSVVDAKDVDLELEAVRRLVERGECTTALELLQATERAWPEDRRVAELRASIVQASPRGSGDSRMPLSHIPVLAEEAAAEPLDSEESFLLSLVDGASDVRSIVGLAALREAEVLGTLELLLDKGLISLREPQPA